MVTKVYAVQRDSVQNKRLSSYVLQSTKIVAQLTANQYTQSNFRLLALCHHFTCQNIIVNP